MAVRPPLPTTEDRNEIVHSVPTSPDGHVTYAVADTPELRLRAYRLIHDSYVRMGYMHPHRTGMRYTLYDALPDTKTFVACQRGDVIATVTLVLDGPAGLPMEEIYAEEVDSLRAQGRRCAEATGLADRRRNPFRTMTVFLNLTRLLVTHACQQGLDDLLVAVNPRHRRFYAQCLEFEQIGPERCYPSVANNPAIPFRLDLHGIEHSRAFPRYFGDKAPLEAMRPRWSADMVLSSGR